MSLITLIEQHNSKIYTSGIKLNVIKVITFNRYKVV